MKFPRELKAIPSKTPSHVKGHCLAMVLLPGGLRKRAGAIISGRPVIEHEGESWKAPRLAFSLNVIALPKTPKTLANGIVCHHCDNAWCVNVKHLYLGTAKQNTADMFARNKFVKIRMIKALKGNQHAKGYKFTKEQRARMSLGLLGNKNKLGKKESAETRRRKSISAKLRAAKYRASLL